MNLPSVAPHRRAGKPCIVRHAGIRRCALGHVGGRCAFGCGQVRLSRRWWTNPRCARVSVPAPPAGGPVRNGGLAACMMRLFRFLTGDCLSRADHHPVLPSLPRPGWHAAVPLPRPVLFAARRGGPAEPAGGFLRWRKGQRCAVGAIAEPGDPDPGERQAARRSVEKAETAARRHQEGQGKRRRGAGPDRRYPDQPGKAVPGREQPGGAVGQPVPAGARRSGGALPQLARPAVDGLRLLGGDPALGLPGQRAALAQPPDARALRLVRRACRSIRRPATCCCSPCASWGPGWWRSSSPCTCRWCCRTR